MAMKQTERAEFARRLRARYEGLDMPNKQAWLIEESGVPERTVQDFTAGEGVPQEKTLTKIAKALGVRRDDVAEREAWPEDVKVFVDIVGMYLTQLPPEKRTRRIGDLTRAMISEI